MNAIKKYIVIAIASLMSVSAFAASDNIVLAKYYDEVGNELGTVWKQTISEAIYNHGITPTSPHYIDSTSVVLYGNTVETDAFQFSNSISIRSAKAGTADQSVSGAPTINSDGYTVTICTAVSSFMEIGNSANCQIGDQKSIHHEVVAPSGPLTFDLAEKGRFLWNYGFCAIQGTVTIKNGKVFEENGGAIVNSGSMTIDSGVLFLNNTAEKGFGGAIYTRHNTVIGTCSFTGNSAEEGSAIYFNKTSDPSSYIRLFDAPNMTTDSDIAYLPAGAYFQKSDLISPTAHLNIQVADEFAGRDIIASNPDANYRNGAAVPGDVAVINMILSDATFEAVYTGHDAVTNRPVIELQKKHVDLTIQKEGMAEGESALFNVKNSSETVIFHNVSVTAGSGGTGSVTIAGLEVGTYTVEEIRAWSWAYTAEEHRLCQDISIKPTFVFTNEAMSTAPAHGESNINNSFTGGGI